MPANVSVAGMMTDGMGGTKESQAAFRKHHKEVGDALLNISGIDTKTGKPTDKDEPRQSYIHQGLPKMLYHAEKGEHVCYSTEEVDEMLRKGWRKEPYLKPQIALEDPKAEKAILEAKLKTQEGTINAQNDLLQKLAARLEAVESKQQEEPAKRGK